MNASQESWWRIGLELKLRQMSGEAFQDFFADLMTAAYGDDYVRVRPYGKLGDKGCDGYHASSGVVHACYGAVDGDGGKAGYLVSKMGDDFEKAKKHLGSIMKRWVMSHNLVSGLPITAVEKLKALEKANPGIEFRFAAFESMAEVLFTLPVTKIERLIGPAATTADNQNFDAEALKALIDAVVAAVDSGTPASGPVKAVSPAKMDHNALSHHWRHLLTMGMQNAPHVAAYFDRHRDPLTGEKVAQRFRDRYAYLSQQALSSDTVMFEILRSIVGNGLPAPNTMVAAQALLAHLFESCDVLEDAPEAVGS